MDQILKRITRLLDEYGPRFSELRARTMALKSKALRWITPAAIIISVVCFWMALSQISLIFHARAWWRLSG
jgi:hypothetical protein